MVVDESGLAQLRPSWFEEDHGRPLVGNLHNGVLCALFHQLEFALPLVDLSADETRPGAEVRGLPTSVRAISSARRTRATAPIRASAQLASASLFDILII